MNGRPVATVGSRTGCGAEIITGADFALAKGQKVAHIGSMTTHGGTITTGSHNTFIDKGSSTLDSFKGGVKTLINEFVKMQASLLAEWLGEEGGITYSNKETCETLSPAQAGELFREQGRDVLAITPDEQSGADTIKNLPQTAAIIAGASAIATRGRSAIREADDIADAIKSALHNSRSSTEAIGKLGMEEAKKRHNMTTDSRYIDRYHGPDDMVHYETKLSELESKGTSTGSTSVAKNSSNELQSSAAKNRRRAKQMLSKRKKINKPSKRQGGPYTREELSLWEEIDDLKGQKKHISTHTHTKTGHVKVLDRDSDGSILKQLDDFYIDDFDVIKNSIMEHFKK